MKKQILFSLALLLISNLSYSNVDINYLQLIIPAGKEIIITTAELEILPTYEIRTVTNYLPIHTYTGVRFSDFAEKYNIHSDKVRIFAWDDYSYTIPTEELIKYDVILAYKIDSKYIDLSELGPYVIIYPEDSQHELQKVDINAKTVWQVKTIKVLE